MRLFIATLLQGNLPRSYLKISSHIMVVVVFGEDNPGIKG